MYDLVVFSDSWPKGLLISQKLADQGKKICHISLQKNIQSPFGILLNEYRQEEKTILQNLGSLFQQDSGVCLLSPEGVWSFQERDWSSKLLKIQKQATQTEAVDTKQIGFKQQWPTYLSKNLMSQIFENNDDDFCKQGLNFNEDYFLFQATEQKKQQFQSKYQNINFLSHSADQIQYANDEQAFLLRNQKIESKKFLWLGGLQNLCTIFKPKKTILPEWQWSCLCLEAELGDYEDIIPAHFVSLKYLSLPWTYDNLLSVFRHGNYWNIWFKKAYNREDDILLNRIVAHLNSIFKNGISFKVIQKNKDVSFPIYGKEKLKNNLSFLPKHILSPDRDLQIQSDLVSQLHYENQLARQWTGEASA